MTREEAIRTWLPIISMGVDTMPELKEALDMAIKALEHEPNRNMEEIKEVINCNADAETKCKMISNILTAKPHYFEEPQESEEEDGNNNQHN